MNQMLMAGQKQQKFPLAFLVASLCGVAVVAVTIFGTPIVSLFQPTLTTRNVNTITTGLLQNPTASRVSKASLNIVLANAEDSVGDVYENAGSASSRSPLAVGFVASLSTVVGALAMRLWGQRDHLKPAGSFDIESRPGASPMEFSTLAPWTSASSLLNGPDFSVEARAGRLVLQAAAKGKGKGGGAKGKIAGIIKLALPAGKATPAPPVGPALGQYGLNIVAFCKEYNAATEKEAADNMIIPVEITAFEDRSYTFVLKTPPASVLLKKAAGVPSGSATPNKEKVGRVTRAQVEEIAKIKLPDLNTTNIEAAMRTVEGTAKQMGITIEG